MQLIKAEQYIQDLLINQLSDKLFYHNYQHTMEVTSSAMQIAAAENITDAHSLSLLKTAALFHDCGYVKTYEQHEEAGCEIAKISLPGFEYNNNEIETICSIIMKTRIPQMPVSILEKILCDADLDYLGMDVFDEKGKLLFMEWQEKGKTTDLDEFNKIQISFLQNHHYWTASSRQRREPVKQEHLSRLKSIYNISADN
jgi:uncharacterized protein